MVKKPMDIVWLLTRINKVSYFANLNNFFLTYFSRDKINIHVFWHWGKLLKITGVAKTFSDVKMFDWDITGEIKIFSYSAFYVNSREDCQLFGKRVTGKKLVRPMVVVTY